MSPEPAGETTSSAARGDRVRLERELEREELWQDVECGAYTADIALWRALAEDAAKKRGSICRLLDLGCGTGRVSLALAASCRVVALDLDSKLIAELRRRAFRQGASIKAITGDVRAFQLHRSFDLVLAPMQLAQLLHTHEELRSMLGCIATHLVPGGIAAIALLEPEGDWEAGADALPLPDMLEADDGWVYASHPVAVRRVNRRNVLELDRIREVVSPAGDRVETLHRERLALFEPDALEGEAAMVGLATQARRAVPATRDHVASTVVVLERAPNG